MVDLSVNLTGLSATSEIGAPVSIGDRSFIITGVQESIIPAGIVMLPTSEDIVLGSSPYIIGSSQFYTIGQVFWNGLLKIEGVDWEFVKPFTHIIRIFNTVGITTAIRLIYFRWDIGVRKDFKVNSYPIPFGFDLSSIVAEQIPPPNQFFTVEYTRDRPGQNPRSLMAIYPLLIDDLLPHHTLYDGNSGFETFRPTGYQVFDLNDNHVYTWNGSSWNGTTLANNTKFYVKRLHQIYHYNLGLTSLVWTAGDDLTVSVPEAVAYPPFGDGIGKNLLIRAFAANAATDFPSAYEISLNPGDFDPWVTG